jgi:hypothetical protein
LFESDVKVCGSQTPVSGLVFHLNREVQLVLCLKGYGKYQRPGLMPSNMHWFLNRHTIDSLL